MIPNRRKAFLKDDHARRIPEVAPARTRRSGPRLARQHPVPARGAGECSRAPARATRTQGGLIMQIGSVQKTSGETRKFSWNLASPALAAGEAISSATVTCAVWSGTDASPSSMISGSATVSSTTVTQTIVGGIAGNIYLLTITAVTSAGQTLKATSYLAIIDTPI